MLWCSWTGPVTRSSREGSCPLRRGYACRSQKGAVSCRAASVSQACPSHQLRSARACDPVFWSTGIKRGCRSAWRVCLCVHAEQSIISDDLLQSMSSPAALEPKTRRCSFSPPSGQLQGGLLHHTLLIDCFVAVSAGARRLLDALPTLDVHCTGRLVLVSNAATNPSSPPAPTDPQKQFTLHRLRTAPRNLTPVGSIDSFPAPTRFSLEDVAANYSNHSTLSFPH
jgi:hypothetical protein